MNLLPKWVLTNPYPSIYDVESGTATEMVAKVYGAMNELIAEYNKMVDEVNKQIIEHQNSTDKDIDCFKRCVTETIENYIKSIDIKMSEQDSIIKDAVDYMKTNLVETIKHLNDTGEFDQLIQRAVVGMEQKYDELNTRMNTFVSLAEGSTTGDAELIDSRIKYNGEKFENLGECLRSQFKELFSYFKTGKNLIPKLIAGGIASTGALTESTSFIRTPYIYLTPGTYTVSNNNTSVKNFAFCLYDLEKTKLDYIKEPTDEQKTFTITEPRLIVITDSKSSIKLQLESGDVATEHEEYYVVLNTKYEKDKENIDSRKDFNDVVFECAGDNIRYHTEKINSNFNYGKNLINKVITGEAISANGSISVKDNFCRTDYILLNTNTYTISNKEGTYSNTRYALFDMSKKNLIRYSTSEFTFEVTEPCYIMIADTISNIELQLEIGDTPTPYQKYYVEVTKDEFRNKTILFEGDSITEGTGVGTFRDRKAYSYLTADKLNMNIINKAVGGSTASISPDKSYTDSTYKPSLITRHPFLIAEFPELWDKVGVTKDSSGNYYCKGNLIEDVNADSVDVIYIAIGSNDWAYGYAPIGNMNDRTPTTFYGALHVICQGFLNKYPEKQIIFGTPIKRRLKESSVNPNMDKPNDITLRDFSSIIKEVCDFYSIPVVDMYGECCMTPYIDSHIGQYYLEYFGKDNSIVHPNETGHKFMSKRVAAAIKSIISF